MTPKEIAQRIANNAHHLPEDNEFIRVANALLEAEKVVEFYAEESEWSGKPWKLLFNSSEMDGHGYEKARTWLNKIRG